MTGPRGPDRERERYEEEEMARKEIERLENEANLRFAAEKHRDADLDRMQEEEED